MIRLSTTATNRLCAAIALCLTLVFSSALTPEAVFSQVLNDGRENTRAGTPDENKPPRSIVEKGNDRDIGSQRDQVILDDLIVDGSVCVGFDCVNGESFGFDTIRLKENNLRIKFHDTSSSASFPSNDWQITINDSNNGGRNMFAIDDIDGGKTPFLIEAGAPTSSLYVDSGGRIGIGTSQPVVGIHRKNGNTPTLRLEQDGSSGFTPQTWDVAGNEAGFFVRDATNNSTLPFRIFPGAPSNAITIHASGRVGIGTTSPIAQLHVIESEIVDPATLLYKDFIMETDEVLAGITVLSTNTSVAGLFFGDPESGIAGGVQYTHSSDELALWANGGPRLKLKSNGDVEVPLGTVVHSSDRRLKKNIEPIADALSTVRSLQGVRFQWKDENRDDRVQIGLIAQDVEKWLPEVVAMSDDDMGTKMVAYSNMVALLIEAIKEQQTIIETQNQALSAMEVQLGALQSSVGRLEGLFDAQGRAAVETLVETNNAGVGR